MKKSIVDRVLKESEYILRTKETVREMAQVFKVSKSTVHKDLKERLKEVEPEKYKDVMEILTEHMKIRHIRGGESTKAKYAQKKES